MGKLNMKEWISQTIQRKETIAIPIMTHPGIEFIGKTVHDAVTNGQVHYEAIKALCDKYPAAAATVIMDLTVEAEAFGAEIIFPENEVPSVSGRLLADEAAIEKLEVPALNKGRIPEYLKANMLTARNVTDRPVFAGCIGPYSLAGRLYDMSEIMMLIYINPDAANTLLRKCSDFITRYCMALKATGVNGVVMAEPAAGLLSNEDCLQYSSLFVKEIIEKVQDDHFAVVLHNCGNTGNCTQAMVYTGAAAYHFGNKIKIGGSVERGPDRCTGNGKSGPGEPFQDGRSGDYEGSDFATIGDYPCISEFRIVKWL